MTTRSRKPATVSDEPAEPTFSVRESTRNLVRRTSGTAAPNPMAQYFNHSFDTGQQLEVDASSDEHADELVKLLQRAQREHPEGPGLRKQVLTDADTGGLVVVFKALPQKRKRAYTNAEVRAWAAENGYEIDGKSKVPTEVLNRFRVANGYETQNAQDKRLANAAKRNAK